MARRQTTAFDFVKLEAQMKTTPTVYGSITALAAQARHELRAKNAAVPNETPWEKRDRVGTWHKADELENEKRIDHEFDKVD